MTEKIETWTVSEEGKPDFTFTIKTIDDDVSEKYPNKPKDEMEE